MQNLKYVFFLSALAIMATSCSRSFRGNPDRLVLPEGTTITYPCVLDKKADLVECAYVSLQRIDDINEEVLNPTAHFEQQFRSVFYHDFFNQIMVEEDLRQAFAQKAVIKQVRPINVVTEKMLKDCSTCNAVADIAHDGKVYLYPYNAPKDVSKALQNTKKLAGKTKHLSFVVFQNKSGEDIRVKFISDKGVQRSYKLVKGSKAELMDALHAYIFPRKDRLKPSQRAAAQS